MDIYEVGFNSFLEKPPLFSSPSTEMQNNFDGVAPGVIASGDLSLNASLVQGHLQSKDFVTGSAGWIIRDDGSVEFSDGIFRGELQAATIKNGEGDILIDSTGLNSSNNFRADVLSSSTLQTTTSSSFVDVPGSTMTSFVLERDTLVTLNFSVFGYNSRYEDTAGQDTDSITVQLVDSVDGIVDVLVFSGIPLVLLDGFLFPVTAAMQPQFNTSTTTALLSAGTHTLKLQFKRETVGTAKVDGFGISYSILGV